MRKRQSGGAPPLEFVAGNGLLHRRALLARRRHVRRRIGQRRLAAPAPPPNRSPSRSGAFIRAPSRRCCRRRRKFEKDVVRTLSNPKGEPRTQHARTPQQMLNGTITPNALHFTIIHSGIPDIDPDKHKLVIHGMVKQPLEFTARRADALSDGDAHSISSNAAATARRCSPRSRSRRPLQALHGLVSCAEWTGVPAVDPARRGRRRSEGEVDASPRAPTRSR